MALQARANSQTLLPKKGASAGRVRRSRQVVKASAQQQETEALPLKQLLSKAALGVGAAASVALSVVGGATPATATPVEGPNPVLDVATLTTGQGGKSEGGKDPEAILRYALPIKNKDIRTIQGTLEEIDEKLKVPGQKSLPPVVKISNTVQNMLSKRKGEILSDVTPSKRGDAEQVLVGLDKKLDLFSKDVTSRMDGREISFDDKSEIRQGAKEILQDIGLVEEMMVDGFPYDVPEQYSNLPQLKGRAVVEVDVLLDTNGRVIAGMAGNTSTSFFLRSQEGRGASAATNNIDENGFLNGKILIVCDGFSAPVTAGNFVDLVNRGFYDGMEVQRADELVVQTGDPDGPAPGFVDPDSGELRNIPLEIKRKIDTVPTYEATFEDMGFFLDQPQLPFNAFGTTAMAREQFDPNSGSSQFFILLKESELTPTGLNLLDGSFSVFGYVVQGEELLSDIKPGDVIKGAKVVDGLENLVLPQ